MMYYPTMGGPPVPTTEEQDYAAALAVAPNVTNLAMFLDMAGLGLGIWSGLEVARGRGQWYHWLGMAAGAWAGMGLFFQGPGLGGLIPQPALPMPYPVPAKLSGAAAPPLTAVPSPVSMGGTMGGVAGKGG